MATAIAQIFSYYQYPTNHSSFSYNWTAMLQHKSYPSYSNYFSAYTYIAHLLYNDIGLGVNMGYSPSASGTSDVAANAYLSGRGYNIYGGIVSYNTIQVLNALDQDKLVLTFGQNWTTSGGHAWVIDGYLHRTREVVPLAEHGQFPVSYFEYQTLVHCNWGWNGNSNGYFIDEAFLSIVEPDTNNNESNTNYNYNNKIIITKH